MKKYIILALVLSALIVTPVLANTPTPTIADLLAIIERLRAQIAELQRQRLVVDPVYPDQWCYNFNKNLGVGAMNSDLVGDDNVNNLQQALIQEGFVIDNGERTARYLSKFGPSTIAAVSRFQEKYRSEILTPNGLARGTGYVGPATRKVLNRLYGCNRPIDPNANAFITPLALPTGKIGRQYSANLSVNPNPRNFDGRSHFWDWTVIGGQLPAGLAFAPVACTMECRRAVSGVGGDCLPSFSCGPSSRNLVGTPTQAGSFDFVIQAKSEDGLVAKQKYTLVVNEVGTNGPPVISNVSGPTTLAIGQTGTWTIMATDPERGTLNYSVLWGDEVAIAAGADASTITPRLLNQQTATFTHSYSQAGNYTAYFRVIDNAGNLATKTVLVRVSDVTTPSITVLSPNGGESWVARSIHPITWRVSNANTTTKVDLYLDGNHGCLLPNGPCPPPYIAPIIVLDKNIAWDATYNWIVATDVADRFITPGEYRVKICLADSLTNCDFSDNYFTTITNPAPANLPPVISGISGPTTLSVGQTGTWTINASDPEGGPLTYTLTWGDEVPVALAEGSGLPIAGIRSQTTTFTHRYSRAGIFFVSAFVKDNAGNIQSTSINVNVTGAVTY